MVRAAGRWEKDPRKRPHFHDLRATDRALDEIADKLSEGALQSRGA